MNDILTFKIDVGLKSIELEVSVPRRDLLGVSGLMKEFSSEPNIIFDRRAGVFHLEANVRRAPTT